MGKYNNLLSLNVQDHTNSNHLITRINFLNIAHFGLYALRNIWEKVGGQPKVIRGISKFYVTEVCL